MVETLISNAVDESFEWSPKVVWLGKVTSSDAFTLRIRERNLTADPAAMPLGWPTQSDADRKGGARYCEAAFASTREACASPKSDYDTGGVRKLRRRKPKISPKIPNTIA